MTPIDDALLNAFGDKVSSDDNALAIRREYDDDISAREAKIAELEQAKANADALAAKLAQEKADEAAAFLAEQNRLKARNHDLFMEREAARADPEQHQDAMPGAAMTFDQLIANAKKTNEE